jgi:hypothetical protein
MASDSAFGTPTIRRVKPLRKRHEWVAEKKKRRKVSHTRINVNTLPAGCGMDTNDWVYCFDFSPTDGKACGSVSFCLGNGAMHGRKTLEVNLETRA